MVMLVMPAHQIGGKSWLIDSTSIEQVLNEFEYI